MTAEEAIKHPYLQTVLEGENFLNEADINKHLKLLKSHANPQVRIHKLNLQIKPMGILKRAILKFIGTKVVERKVYDSICSLFLYLDLEGKGVLSAEVLHTSFHKYFGKFFRHDFLRETENC